MTQFKGIGSFYVEAFEGYEEKLLYRVKQFDGIVKNFEETFNSESPCKVSILISTERLELALISYFFDIHRYKHFHGMLDENNSDDATVVEAGKVNFFKICAFMCKWICKEKPFTAKFIKADVEGIDDESLYKITKMSEKINELLMITWIDVNLDCLFGLKLPDEGPFRRRLCYNLKYRDISTGLLELLLECYTGRPDARVHGTI